MIDYAPLIYSVEPMRPEDISAVMEIEHVAFSAPWSARAYDYELHYNEMAHYFVVRPQQALPPTAQAFLSHGQRKTPASLHRAPGWEPFSSATLDRASQRRPKTPSPPARAPGSQLFSLPALDRLSPSVEEAPASDQRVS